MKRDSHSIVERMIPVALMHAVVYFGVKDREHPEHAAVLRMLEAAVNDEVSGLPLHQQESCRRHAQRVCDTIIAPYVAEHTPVVKFGLATFYVVNDLIEGGTYERTNAQFEKALEAILNPEGTLTELANIEKFDASAQKQARRLRAALTSLGYFTTQDERELA